MTEAVAAAPVVENAEPVDQDLADLTKAFGGEPAPAVEGDEPAVEAAEEKPAPEAEKAPEKSPPKLYTEALKLKDQANQQVAEAKKMVADAERRASELEQREQEFLRREQETKKADGELSSVIKKDPMAAFERLGFTPHDLARWCMEDDGQRSQRVEKDERTEAQKALDERLQRIEEREQRLEQERAQQAMGQAQRGFVAFVDQNHAKYPDIADEDPDDLAAVMWEVAKATRDKHNIIPTWEQIAEHLQNAASAKRARRDERRTKRATPQAPASSSEQSPTPRENGHTATSPGPRTAPKTLSNAASTELASGPRELSAEELDRESLAELKKMWGTSAA
jgi:hypothetical protein